MRFRRSMWLGTALVAAALVTGVRAFAQQTFDHPTYKGNNARQGKNSDPTHNSPGKSNLRWWTPNGTGTSFFQPIIDDTDTNPTTVVADGPYDPNPYGFIQSTAGWFGPGTDEEASMVYTLPIRRIPTATAPVNYDLRVPAYRYATCSPTLATPYDPRVAASGTTLRTFNWTFTGEGNQPKNYSIYVNIPIGPTKIGGFNRFPQQFFTYEISWGPGGNQKFVDIVDTYAAGGGWVRLGSGGRPGNVVFPYDGRNPITVKLFNTVPRDQNGKLTMKVPAGASAPYQGMDQYLVYADAIKFAPATGSYSASPSTMRLIDGNPLSAVVTSANNEITVGQQNGVPTTVEKGVVSTYTYNANLLWRYSPLDESRYPYKMDNSGRMTGDFVGENVKRFEGPDAAVAPITNTAPGTGFVIYNTDTSLTDQTYDIYVYLPGSFSAARQYATRATYTVYAEGTQYTYRVDQSVARGWVRLGNRRFRNIPPTPLSTGQPIQVVVSNYSPRAADLGKYAYSDAIRFVGENNRQITSTPVHASALIRKNTGVTEETKVVLISDENGVIHCLDAIGNTDGTTTEYWSYPSLPDDSGFDPNLGSPTAGNGPDYNGATDVPAAERSPTAEMPQGFDLSSGLVQRIGGVDYLFIGSSNGRVYCINMAGRGDYNTTDPQGGLRVPGTTTRNWTYPSTYPAANSVSSSDLLQIRGSVAYGEPNNQPTIFIPTMSGRIYAVAAVGNADTSTSVRWTYPNLNQPHLGPIAMTPAVAFNRVYFGTLRNALPTGDVQGQFYAIDWTNGNLVWGRQYDDDFLASPAVATGAELEPANPTPGPGLIFAANQNRNVIAFDPNTGAEQWFTNIGSGVEGSLEFAWQTVYNNLGTLVPFPVVIVPTQSGHFYSLFARTADLDQYGTRLAWGYQTAGGIRASMAIQGLSPNTNPLIDPPTGWMYGADDLGFLYAFNNDNGYLVNGNPPGTEDLTPNNPLGQVFRKTLIKVIKRSEYQRLRLPTKLTPPRETTAPYDYTMAYPDAKAIVGQNPANLAFEWGQTAYILVYNFPFITQNSATQTVDPPIVNVSFSMNGKTVRGVAVQARQFSLPNEAEPDGPPTYNTADAPGTGVYPPLDPALGGDEKMDGYAILAFPFQNSGANSLPPGDGEISISISTASLNSNNVQQNVLLNPAVGASRFPFKIANPLALIMPTPGNPLSATYRGNVPAGSNYSFGLSTSPSDPENLGNGSFNVGAKNASLLGASTELVGHGTTGKSVIWVVDRSMMSLLRPDGTSQGLDGVRMDRRDLGWQGGAAAVYKKIGSYGATYDGFEDLPVNSPNNSISYPDILSDRVSATKDPSGAAENPLFNGVTLLPPLKLNGDPLDEDTAPTDRLFRVTPFEIDVEVPRFQPPNTRENLAANAPTARIPDSAGGFNQQGYMGRLDVFVDSAQNGRLDTTTREAYRSFNLSTAVDVDERLSVTTPSVDLGTLPSGYGYYPGFPPGATTVTGPSTDARALQPWGGNYQNVFKTFGVQNEGNVNLLNVRVAKSSTFAWPFDRVRIGAGENDGFTWLDGLFDVWSDLDPQFGASPIAGRPVILPKARVQDRVPSTLQSNPIRRENQNLGKTGLITIGGNVYRDALNTTLDDSGTKLYYRHGDNIAGQSVHSPVVGVSIPIGFPVGKYQERVRVFEDYAVPNNVWDGNSTQAESYTDPGFLLSFNVSETRLTSSAATAPMVDSLAPNGAFGAANLQPAAARDAFGSLLLAWASNRPNLTTAPSAADTGAYRLYLSSLDSGATFSTGVGGNISAPGESPLRDLNSWNPGSTTHWFKPYTGAANGYPSVPDASIFGLGAGESFVGPVRYGNPAFPSAGEKNPFGSDYFNGMYMAFTGQTQRKNADNTVQNDSRLLLSIVSANGNGNISVSDPFVLGDNPQAVKGKPAVIQGGSSGSSSAIVLYPATSAGTSSILYTRFDPSAGFHKSQVVPLGNGFSTVTSPSASARIANPGLPGGNRPVIDFTFQGKLRGRPYPEAFLGRLNVVVPGTGALRLAENADGTLDAANLFAPLPPETDENVQAEAEAGLYRARGVYWDISQSVTLTQILGTVSTNLLINGTQAYDQQTGIISYNTKLGGKVYLDPALGTVRFSNSVPSRNARIQLSYTPRFLRVSAGGAAGYYDPVGLFDNRLITDASYWRLANGNQADLNVSGRFSGPVTNDRLLFTYNRAASGPAQAARPYMYSVRFGLRLDYRLPTLPNGVPGIVQGNNTRDAVQRVFFPPAPPADIGDGFGQDVYQIDAAQGRIYFPAADEGRLVRISYYAVDSAGNLILDNNGRPLLLVKQGIVSLLAETGETAIPIETSVNESNLVPTLDPFSYANAGGGSQAYRRPPLVWLFWTSTRNGTPDLYFESVAPRWSPIPVGH